MIHETLLVFKPRAL